MVTSRNDTCSVPDETKEACALETMHYMLRHYAQDNNLSFENALLLFSSSAVYQVLFDFETGVWREGPDYLRCLFEQAAKNM